MSGIFRMLERYFLCNTNKNEERNKKSINERPKSLEKWNQKGNNQNINLLKLSINYLLKKVIKILNLISAINKIKIKIF